MPLEQIPRHVGQHVVYQTIADQGTYAVPAITSEHLATTMKANAVVADHVYVSASHVFSSRVTFEAMEACAPLAESGSIIVGLRNDCRDFHEFAEYVLSSREQEEVGATPEEVLQRAKGLDRLVTKVHRWRPRKSQPRFQQAIVGVLRNPHSLLRSRLEHSSEGNIDRLACEIEALDSPLATRRKILELARRHTPADTEPIMREANLVYYGVGATGSNLVPDLDSHHFHDLIAGARWRATPPVSLTSSDALNVILDAFEVSERLMMHLTPSALARFASDNPTLLSSFREKWWLTIENATAEAQALRADVSSTILEALKEAAFSETLTGENYRKAARGISLSSFVVGTAALAAMDSLAVGLFSYLLGLASAGAALESVERDITKGPFRLLSTSLANLSKVERASADGT